ncbi:BatD family protein [Xanthobacter flavus]|uniref:BatD family protein n=1 Tax=Xanthobacter flavus TaxID=281 RepID=UPI0037264910
MIRAALRTCLFVLALALWATAVSAASFKATVEKPPTDQGDTFELVLSVIGRDSLEPPNISPLNRDFEILDRGKRSRMESVNGRMVEVNEWVLTLSPKRAGHLVIPALTLGSETSAPIEMDVAPGSTAEPPDDGPIALSVDVLGTPPFYLQSEIPVVVRMYDRVGALEASADQPAADGATFTPDGTLKRFSRIYGRQRYRVVELRYIMRPQRTGTIQISSVALRASIPVSPPGAQEQARAMGRPAMPWLGGGFDAGRKVTVFANPVEVTILPRPAGVTGWFLPARAVRLKETWSSPPAKAKVGVALTRTLRLEVQGASPAQLPPLKPAETDGVRQYADEEHPEATQVGGAPGAIAEVHISVVPTRAGSITLPAITVPWWNITTNRAETAQLPPVTLQVAGAADPAGIAPPPAPAKDAPKPQAAPADDAGPLPLRDIAAIALVVVMIGGFLLFSGRRAGRKARAMAEPPAGPVAARPTRPGRPTPTRPAVRRPRLAVPDEKAAAGAVEAACKAGHATAAYRAYLDWNRASGPGHAGTASARTPAMAAALHEISRHLYAGDGDTWDGQGFRSAFAAERKAALKPARARTARGLAPLYPKAR